MSQAHAEKLKGQLVETVEFSALCDICEQAESTRDGNEWLAALAAADEGFEYNDGTVTCQDCRAKDNKE